MFDWLDNTVIKLCTMPPVGTDLNTVKDQLNEMKVCTWERVLKEDCFTLGFVCFVWGGELFCLLAACSLHCCVLSFSSCGEWGLATLELQCTASHCGFSSCGAQTSVVSGAQAYLPCSMWNLLTSGIKHVFPALAGRPG